MKRFQIPEDGHYRISFSGVVGGEDEGYATLVLQDENLNNLAVVEMGKITRNKMIMINYYFKDYCIYKHTFELTIFPLKRHKETTIVCSDLQQR